MLSDQIVQRGACPRCVEQGRDTAQDNLYTFESGVQYCVACAKTISIIGKNMTKTPLCDGIYTDIKSRKISKKTCEFYGYMINSEKKLHIANYYDDAGSVVMQQHRTTDKKFPIYGNKNHRFDLWGMTKFNPDEKVFITITEGQIDALSIAEVFDCKFPVVSLPNGASSADEVISKNLHKLNKYKYVVLAFDNDEPGREATQKCLKLFEPGKVRVAEWSLKDANELLKLDKRQEIKETIYGAVAPLPAPILTGSALTALLDNYNPKSNPWPWETANRILSPVRIPGVYTIAGLSGVGKTSVMADLIRFQIEKGNRIGIISLEESLRDLQLKVAGMMANKNLLSITNRALTAEERDYCKKVEDYIVTYDHITYSSDLNSILEHLPYFVKMLGCEYIIFDNISYSASGMSGGEGERNNIDKAMKMFKDSAMKNEYVLFNVAHLNKNDILEDSTMRGSQGMENYSDKVIYISRENSSQDLLSRNTLNFYIKKDRLTGRDTGKSFKLYYNHEMQKLEDFK